MSFFPFLLKIFSEGSCWDRYISFLLSDENIDLGYTLEVTSTHNHCFKTETRNKVYPSKSQFNHISRVVRKPAFCICENTDADQLRSTFVSAALIVQSLYFLNTNDFKPLAILCGRTAWSVCDLVGNPEDRFSHNEAHIKVQELFLCTKDYT